MSNAILMALVPVFFVLLLGYAAGGFVSSTISTSMPSTCS